MDNPTLYDRQSSLNLLYPHAIAVIGCGGIGSWVAIYAAMSGVNNLHLYDTDMLEEHNRNRLPFCQGSLNRPKVEVVAEFIRGIRPEANVFPIAVQFTKDMVMPLYEAGIQYFIDCTDSPKSQIEIYKECSKSRDRIKYIRAGYDGIRIMVTGAVSGWIKVDEERERYEVNPSWVVPSATVAALAVFKMMYSPDQEVGLELSEIGIPVLEKQKRVTARCKQKRNVPSEEGDAANEQEA